MIKIYDIRINEDLMKAYYQMSWRMPSSGMLRRVALVRTDVSEEPSASIIKVTRIGELWITLAITDARLAHLVFLHSVHRLLVKAIVVPSSLIFVTQMMEEAIFFETSVLTRATRRNIPEEGILHSHRLENLRSYIWNILLYSPHIRNRQ
jgi:hypothetical protein